MTFTHVLNPFLSAPGSEHCRAQEVTFASMRRAVSDAIVDGINVEVLAAVFPDDMPAVEAPARALPVLGRSTLDIAGLRPRRRFPFLADILDAAYSEGSGDYLVYTNVDISLQPHFYQSALRLLKSHGEPAAIAINRRSIRGDHRGINELELMYAEEGRAQPGYDCFIFPRAWVPRLKLGHVCIGTRHFDGLLIANLDLLSGYRFEIFREERLTFHLGEDLGWLARVRFDEFNFRETLEQLTLMQKLSVPQGHHYGLLCKWYREEGQIFRTLKRRLKNRLIELGLHHPRGTVSK